MLWHGGLILTNRPWPKRFSKAARWMRWGTICAVGVVAIPTAWLLCSTPWSTALTATGAILGVIGIWLTLEIFRIGDDFSTQQQDLISEVHKTVMTASKTTHFQELRRQYELAKAAATGENDPKVNYWHFIWRFETYSELSISLVDPQGHARIRILGTNIPAFDTNFEKMSVPIYTVDVLEVKCPDNRLSKGRAYCWCLNATLYISDNANEIELQAPFATFIIVGLGPIRGGAVGPRPKNFPRLRDVQNPSSSNQEND